MLATQRGIDVAYRLHVAHICLTGVHAYKGDRLMEYVTQG